MKNWASKILTLTILGVFSLSLISMEYIQPKKTDHLQSLIIQVKELRQTAEDNSSDFQTVVSKTISTLNDIASPNILVTAHTDENTKAETIRIIVKTRTPYVLNHYEPVRKIVFYQIVTPTEQTSLYQSHLISPETPPPIFS